MAADMKIPLTYLLTDMVPFDPVQLTPVRPEILPCNVVPTE